MSLAEAITNRVEGLRSNQDRWIKTWVNHFRGIHPLLRSGDQRDSLKSLTQLHQANSIRINELERLLNKE